MQVTIDGMTPEDWDAVRDIYHQGIATGDATFETEVPQWDTWDRLHSDSCRLVARNGTSVLGWSAVLPLSTRAVYAGVGEVTTYVGLQARGKKIGKLLLASLVDLAEREELWSLQATMFPTNKASVALHKACGFRKVGTRKRLGRLEGKWRDVLLMERRSSVVGK